MNNRHYLQPIIGRLMTTINVYNTEVEVAKTSEAYRFAPW